jgi:hypothetical protein
MLRPMLKSRDRAEANYGRIYKLMYSTKSRIEVYLHVRVVQYPRSCHWSVIWMFPVARYEVRLHSLPTGICLNLKHSQMSVIGIEKNRSQRSFPT